jgi:Cyclin, N-terminal domain/Cyclin, C-terminal domain
VDFCNFNRETVAIATSIMDRFMSTQLGQAIVVDRNQYQLVSMTSLYTAVKIHEPEVMSAELVSQLSRGAHSEKEIELMERRILQALTWQVNPPTALSFVREFLKLLPLAPVDGEDTKVAIYEMCKFQSELAIADGSLIGIAASYIAYASFMNSLESLGCMDQRIVEYVGSILSQAARINLLSLELSHVQDRLCHSVAINMQAATKDAPAGTSISHTAGGCCGPEQRAAAPRRSSYKASPCTVTRIEV